MTNQGNSHTWPGWETVHLIGRGSFGAVYEIERDMLGEKEKAALKVITIPQSSSDIDELYGEGYDDESITSTFKAYLKSIVAEYSLMRKMNGSANVVNCDDVRYVQHDDGIGWDIFIKMELLTPLTKALGKEVSEEQVIRIGTDICKALILCRKHDIIHRDIKPANIFVSENGDYKLGDFGIAKTVEKTSGGTKIGTYEYMAPEVYHDQPYGSTVDIYSLGMVLYWLLNERRTPFLELPPSLPTNPEKEQARKRRFGGEPLPAPAHGSEELKRVVLKACAFDPKDRYQSAEDMQRDLENLSKDPRASARDMQKSDQSTVSVESCTIGERNSEQISKLTEEKQPEIEETVGLFEIGGERKEKAPEEKAIDGLETEKEEPTVGVFSNHSAGPELYDPDIGKEKKRKKKSGAWIATALLAASAIIALFAIHVWDSTTCEVPKIFSICDKTGGESSENDWTDATYEQETETAVSIALEDRTESHVDVPATEPEDPEKGAYEAAESLAASGKVYEAAVAFYRIKDYRDSWQRCFDLWGTITRRDTIAAGSASAVGSGHTVGLKTDGTVLAVGENDAGQCDVSDWQDIIAVAAGFRCTVGLKSDGTVVAVGADDSLNSTEGWQDIVAIAEGYHHTVGLKADGTVVAAGYNEDDQSELEGWRDIIAISAGDSQTVGLKADGTVVAMGDNKYGQIDVDDWRDIVAIAAGNLHTVGLKSDGTVVAVGFSGVGECSVGDWRDIVAINAGHQITFGLKADGSVIVTEGSYNGRGFVAKWTEIVDVAAGSNHTVGLRADGTVVTTGLNYSSQCNVSEWKNIALPVRHSFR